MATANDASPPSERRAQQEFEALYQRTSRSAYLWAYRLLGHAADAEDVAQEAFARAWRHFDRYDRSRPFERWLYRIVANLATEQRRQRMKTSFYSLEAIADAGVRGSEGIADPTTDPELLTLSAEFGGPLQAALDALPPTYRLAVLSAFVDGLSYESIARASDCPIGTIRTRIHRARLLLRKGLSHLEQETDEEPCNV